jgi:hypothetical protein
MMNQVNWQTETKTKNDIKIQPTLEIKTRKKLIKNFRKYLRCTTDKVKFRACS